MLGAGSAVSPAMEVADAPSPPASLALARTDAPSCELQSAVHGLSRLSVRDSPAHRDPSTRRSRRRGTNGADEQGQRFAGGGMLPASPSALAQAQMHAQFLQPMRPSYQFGFPPNGYTPNGYAPQMYMYPPVMAPQQRLPPGQAQTGGYGPPAYGQGQQQAAMSAQHYPGQQLFYAPRSVPVPGRKPGQRTGWGGAPLARPPPPLRGAGSSAAQHGDNEATSCDWAVEGDSSEAGAGATEVDTPVQAPSPTRQAPSSNGQTPSSNGQAPSSREQAACAFFLKTGTCAYGDRCKFAHPYDRAPSVEFNSLGLPLRPDEPVCTFFLKNLRCAFGHTCKFHHPEMMYAPARMAFAAGAAGMVPGMAGSQVVLQPPGYPPPQPHGRPPQMAYYYAAQGYGFAPQGTAPSPPHMAAPLLALPATLSPVGLAGLGMANPATVPAQRQAAPRPPAPSVPAPQERRSPAPAPDAAAVAPAAGGPDTGCPDEAGSAAAEQP